jgi:hypothetical protein
MGDKHKHDEYDEKRGEGECDRKSGDERETIDCEFERYECNDEHRSDVSAGQRTSPEPEADGQS